MVAFNGTRNSSKEGKEKKVETWGLREKSHNVLSGLVWDRAVPDSPHFMRSQGLGHPGRQPHPTNHRALHRSGKRHPRPPPWHHLPWEVLKADPAFSLTGRRKKLKPVERVVIGLEQSCSYQKVSPERAAPQSSQTRSRGLNGRCGGKGACLLSLNGEELVGEIPCPVPAHFMALSSWPSSGSEQTLCSSVCCKPFWFGVSHPMGRPWPPRQWWL